MSIIQAKLPIAWTIAGSDSGGGAGIQADLLTCHDFNVHCCTVITALTAQNSLKVSHIEYASIQNIRAQIHTLYTDLPPQAIKLGMLGSLGVLREIKDFLLEAQQKKIPIICDPVMVSTSGSELFPRDTLEYFIQNILPCITLLTPNVYEAEVLASCKINNFQDMEIAAKKICQYDVKNVLIKGGHKQQDKQENNYCEDFWTNGKESSWLIGHRQQHLNRHGSGCSLASAITACLAQDYSLLDALVIAKTYVTQGIRLAKPYGQGPGPVHHAGWPSKQCDFPWLTTPPFRPFRPPSPARGEGTPSFGPEPIGFYPIIDNLDYLEKLLVLGVKTIQLRIKNLDNSSNLLEEKIHKAIVLARHYTHTRLFINDHWQLAIKHGAYGIHLGQEDLDTADYNQIIQSGLRLGISTHSYEELARAHAWRPSYIAYGPIFTTDTKKILFNPQGLIELERVCKLMNDYPIVAIGGITYETLPAVTKAGVNGIAVISAITQAKDVTKTAKQWLDFGKDG